MGQINLPLGADKATRIALQKLSAKLTGNLTANRLLYYNDGNILSVDPLTNWIAGTANQITSTDDGDGTITLSTPQDIHTGASPTFVGLDLTGITDSNIPYISASGFADSTLSFDGTDLSISSGKLIIPDAGYIGSASDTDAIQIEADGDVVLTQDITVSGELKLESDSTKLAVDGSNNMTFTDAVVGTRTLKQLGCPTYKYIKATTQAEGDLHLSDATYWGISKALIKYIRVITSSTNWDLYILQNDNSYATDDANIPKLKIADGIVGNANLWFDMPYEDEDNSDEVHLYYLDNSGSNTADFYIIGLELL